MVPESILLTLLLYNPPMGSNRYNLIIHIDLILQYESNFYLRRQYDVVERLSLLETFSHYLLNGWLILGKLYNFSSLAISEKWEQ